MYQHSRSLGTNNTFALPANCHRQRESDLYCSVIMLVMQIDNVIIELHETSRAIIGLPVASGHRLFDYTGLSCHKQQTRRHSRSTGSDNSSLMIACRALARSCQISILADCFCFRSQFGNNHITRTIQFARRQSLNRNSAKARRGKEVNYPMMMGCYGGLRRNQRQWGDFSGFLLTLYRHFSG